MDIYPMLTFPCLTSVPYDGMMITEMTKASNNTNTNDNDKMNEDHLCIHV